MILQKLSIISFEFQIKLDNLNLLCFYMNEIILYDLKRITQKLLLSNKFVYYIINLNKTVNYYLCCNIFSGVGIFSCSMSIVQYAAK